ncbi:hypothetical protein Drorol1_Dr00000546 [Drosera rotundifolia]
MHGVFTSKGSAVYDHLMASILKFKQMETKAPKRGRKQEGGAVRSAYLEGCVFALLVWAYEHLDGTILKPTKIVRLPRMFRWEDKKAPSNPEATNKLLGEVVGDQIKEFVASSDEKAPLLGIDVPEEHVLGHIAKQVQDRKNTSKRANLMQ